jgi:hypothetical protein
MSTEASQNSAKRRRGGHWKPAFLEFLRASASVTDSARGAGVSRRGTYKAREKDEEFREAWEDALEEATDALEAEARRRALEGVREPVFYQGKEVGSVQRYSDTLLIFLLKGRRREVFGDKTDHTSGGKEITTFTLDLGGAKQTDG